MKNLNVRIRKIFTLAGLTGVLIFSIYVTPITVNAQSLTDFVPYETYCANNSCVNAFSDSLLWVQLGLSSVFTGIVAFGIFTIIRGALKIINSDGNEEKMKEAYQSFSGVFFGIIVIFIGIVGIVVISLLFNSGEVFQTPVEIPGV